MRHKLKDLHRITPSDYDSGFYKTMEIAPIMGYGEMIGQQA